MSEIHGEFESMPDGEIKGQFTLIFTMPFDEFNVGLTRIHSGEMSKNNYAKLMELVLELGDGSREMNA